MKITYFKQHRSEVVVRCVSRDDGATNQTVIVVDEANTDYQEYLKWLADADEPLPVSDSVDTQSTIS